MRSNSMRSNSVKSNSLKSKVLWSLGSASLAVAALAGCSAGAPGTGYSAPGGSAQSTAPSAAPSTAPSTGTAESASGAALSTTSSSSLGTIVVDAKGMTVYVFDKDTAGSGKSSCSGDCLANWPAVTTTSSSPTATGVTGKIGTIAGTNGARQLTLNGSPLYTYAGDKASGDTNGQAVGGTWWVVAPSGDKISTAAKSGY